MSVRRSKHLYHISTRLQVTKNFLEESAVTIDIVRERAKVIDELWDDFRKLEVAMVENDEEETTRQQVDMSFMEIRALVMRLEREMAIPTNVNEDKDLTEIFRQQNLLLREVMAGNHRSNNDANLPKLSIEPFSGERDQWITFRDKFVAAIHSNPKIAKINKFQYLSQFLKGETQYLISDMKPTEQNYDIAWDLLCTRYNNNKFIINSFIRKFMSQTPIEKPDAAGLRKILDRSDAAIRGIDIVGANSKTRDPWLIYTMVQLLDKDTKLLWAEEVADEDFPTFEHLLDFLRQRCNTLETNQSFQPQPRTVTQPKVRSMSTEIQDPSNNGLCTFCSADHFVYACTKFIELDPQARRKFTAENRLCFNCLRVGHSQQYCRSRLNCHKCRKPHHTLLHVTPQQNPNNNSDSPLNALYSPIPTSINSCDSVAETSSINNHVTSSSINKSTSSINRSPHAADGCSHDFSIQPTASTSTGCHVDSNLSAINACIENTALLPTVVFNVTDGYGNLQPCRALLDSGAQATFITESCAQRLALRRSNSRLQVSGMAATVAGHTRGRVSLIISPRHNNTPVLEVTALIMPLLTNLLPTVTFNTSEWEYIRQLNLADPTFNKSSPIDIILGSNHFFKVILNGQVLGPSGYPLARETIFGWVVSGEMALNSTVCSYKVTFDLDTTLRKFWEVEEVPSHASYTEEEQACEKIFNETTTRNGEGRYVVRLPFKENSIDLGYSYKLAFSRLQAMERKFLRNPNLKLEYKKFIDEYLSLNHMEPVLPSDQPVNERTSFYLPHHAVIKESSTTTRLRVVFDGSATSSSGISLNDKLMIGATTQRTMFETIVRFRRHLIAIAADIQKMYRQVMVDHSDCDYQRILWRENDTQPVQTFRLLTVTYGLASAPFLAIHSLQQLAHDIRPQSSTIADVICNDFYVDDLMTGASDLESATSLLSDLMNYLKSGGFLLRKWKSNSEDLLSNVPVDHRESTPLEICDEPHSIGILGVQWVPEEDYFTFKVAPSNITNATKRSLLSDAAKVYDPLGWISPCTIRIKILFQKLWLQGIDWDDPLPDDITTEYQQFRSEFHLLGNLRIRRCILKHRYNIQLHGFSDASELAYSGVVYLRCESENGECEVQLVAAKTKVAPIKQITLPRLELLGAVLVCKLLKGVSKALDLQSIPLFAWTDSTIVLCWLSSVPRRWKSFVANRTSEILSITERSDWRHVPTEENPADCASRGLQSSELLIHHLWWTGPDWLKHPRSQWPKFDVKSTVLSDSAISTEARTTTILHNTTTYSYASLIHDEFLERFSDWSKLLIMIALCSRFISNCRRKRDQQLLELGFLSPIELENAKFACFLAAQESTYRTDIRALNSNQPLVKSCELLSLNPFIDDTGLLRVGGRLTNADAPFSTRHPIILPRSHHVTKLLLKDIHYRYFHAGPTLMTSILRQRYWIPRGRNAIRSIVHQCKECALQRARPVTQIMGNLPAMRVNAPTRPFFNTGVDYAGPVNVKSIYGRSSKIHKAYIAVFVCMATKAIHLEVVTALSSAAFLATFRRFIARRGLPKIMCSDNGRNFLGASRELRSFKDLAVSEHHNDFIATQLALDGIQWLFIPPYSPNFGGLWEAGVKSTKFHLTRVTKDQILDFDRLSTFLCQIEGILNSRPLCAISEDVTSFDVLTPGHFLIGCPITALPEPCLDDISRNRLDRWQAVQQMVHGFWKRWHHEYLTTLQQRTKWKYQTPNLHEGNLVAIRHNDLPPTKWALGRILKCIPGQDGKVRVAKVQTQHGQNIYSLNKLCLLPVN